MEIIGIIKGNMDTFFLILVLVLKILHIHAIFISNNVISNAKLRLNFCYLKIIQFLHPRYHPKIIEHCDYIFLSCHVRVLE